MQFVGKNLIGFDFVVESNSNNFSKKFKNQTVFFKKASAQQVDKACFLAKNAVRFSIGSEKGKELLHEIASQLEENAIFLVELFCFETNLSESRARAELSRTCFQLRTYCNTVTELELNSNKFQNAHKEIIKRFLPIGPVVVFGASNFPFAYGTIGGDVAGAFASGCPVIVKAHPYHPLLSDVLAQIIRNALLKLDFPPGFFSHLYDDGHTVAQQLVINKNIKGVAFTGSFTGGMSLQKLIQTREEPIPFFGEMSSVNPVLISEAKLKNHNSFLKELVFSMTNDAGQFCTQPGIFVTIKSNANLDFKNNLIEALSQIEAQEMLHPNIIENYKQKCNEYKDFCIFSKNGENHKIYPYLAEIDFNTFKSTTFYQEEVFGPFSLIVLLDNQHQFKEFLELLRGQLTISLHFEDDEKEFVEELKYLASHKTGRIIENGFPTGVEVTKAMVHGGPFPATSDARFTAVGDDSVLRFLRPVALQKTLQ